MSGFNRDNLDRVISVESVLSDNMSTTVAQFTDEHLKACSEDKFLTYSLDAGVAVEDANMRVVLYTA